MLTTRGKGTIMTNLTMKEFMETIKERDINEIRIYKSKEDGRFVILHLGLSGKWNAYFDSNKIRYICHDCGKRTNYSNKCYRCDGRTKKFSSEEVFSMINDVTTEEFYLFHIIF